MVMISHGISTGALFLLIGMIYERRHTRLIDAYGGIARVVPVFSLILTVVALSSIGLPGLNGFVGEFLVLLGSFARLSLGHRDRHDRGDLRRRLPALGAPAHDLQPAGQPGEREPDRPDPAGAGGDAAPDRGHCLAGLVPGAGPAPNGAGHPALRRSASSPLPGHHRPAGRGRRRGGEPMIAAGPEHAAGITLALLPEVLLTGWALIVLLVASWRHGSAEDSRLAGWLSFAGVAVSGAGLAGSGSTTSTPVGLAQMMALDTFRYAAAAIVLVSAGGDDPAVARVSGAGAAAGARVLPADSAGDGRHDVPGGRRGPDRAVPRARSDVGRGLRPGRLQPGQRALGRGGAQVLPHRGVRLRVPALRHRAGLRCHRARPTCRSIGAQLAGGAAALMAALGWVCS